MSGMVLRQLPRISYSEPEIPDLDEYIYCDECNDYIYEYCSLHGPLLVIPDDKVCEAAAAAAAGVPRAALTVPAAFLHLARSAIPGAGLGVFATRTLPRGVRFGPYRGRRAPAARSAYCWQLYSSERRPWLAVDAADARRANWMRYVNCARHCSEQNLAAFQYRGQIYYRTIKIIPRFTELLVFYGTQFAKDLNIDVRRYNLPLARVPTCDAPVSKKPKFIQPKTVENNLKTTEESKPSGCASQPMQESIKKQKVQHVIKNNKIGKRHETKSKIVKNKLKKCSDIKENMSPNVNNDTNIKQVPETLSVCTNIDVENNNLPKEKPDSKHDKNVDMSYYLYCDVCNTKCVTKDSLTRHMRLHDKGRGLACEYCNRYFSTKSNLHKHIKIHTGEKAYKCDTCEKSFIHKAQLISHIRTHTGEKAYSCKVCFKAFITKNKLSIHMRIHTGDKPFTCNTCNKSFKQSPNLIKHIRTHTGEQPYSCDICDYKCADSSNLKRHLKAKHLKK